MVCNITYGIPRWINSLINFFKDLRHMRMIESIENEILRKKRFHGIPGR